MLEMLERIIPFGDAQMSVTLYAWCWPLLAPTLSSKGALSHVHSTESLIAHLMGNDSSPD